MATRAVDPQVATERHIMLLLFPPGASLDETLVTLGTPNLVRLAYDGVSSQSIGVPIECEKSPGTKRVRNETLSACRLLVNR